MKKVIFISLYNRGIYDLSVVSFTTKDAMVYIRHGNKFQTLHHKQIRAYHVRNVVTSITK